MRDGAPLIRTADDPLIGTTIAGRYVVEALVGEGAMALVYRAHHARLSRLFALKLMFGDVAADASMRLRFAQEADAASRMSHPNVVSVLDFGKTEAGLLYLAMDYAQGETLAAVIRREGALPEQRVVALVKQMARGLGHAHRAGLVHRDFKPANVALVAGEDDGELARILDFGLAIAEGDGSRIGRLTEHGLVVGTPIYISPEQARDQVVDHRADLFALGVVMYEMLAGKPPFEGTSQEIARANVTQTPPPLSQRNPQVRVQPEVEAIALKLMAKRAADRYQTADEVIAALSRLGRRTTAPVAVPLPPSDPQQTARLRSPVQWLFKSATFRWGGGREPQPPERGRETGGRTVVTSAATVIDVGTGEGTDEAVPTILDVPIFEDASAGRAVPEQRSAWGRDRDGQPTQGMTQTAVQRDLARQTRRRRLVAAAWLALIASGAVCTTMDGQRPAAGESTDDLAGQVKVDRNWLSAQVGGLEPVTLTWVRAVSEQIGSAVRSMGVRPARTAAGRFEGKMEPARARRCPTVQNAEPTGAGPRSSNLARCVDTDRSRRSAPPSPRSSRLRPQARR